jgi:hypothetical protein
MTMRNNPFHEGEIVVQERTGERDIAVRNGAAISAHIGPGALSFLARQRLVAVSAAEDAGRLWTTVWSGKPGFVQSADGQRVTFRHALMQTSPDDPVLSGGLAAGRELGVLAIDFASRRRSRINGTVESVSADVMEIAVRESLANCPKYIERRQPHDLSASSPAPLSERGVMLDERRRALISRADTAFVGSVHPTRGLDTSHRGGASGFIHSVDARTLRIPDYPGNSMFLTLGNFSVDPRASLTALDFEGGRILAMSGSARLRFGAEDRDQASGGTGRYWDFSMEQWMEFAFPSSVQWEWLDSSPYNPQPART